MIRLYRSPAPNISVYGSLPPQYPEGVRTIAACSTQQAGRTFLKVEPPVGEKIDVRLWPTARVLDSFNDFLLISIDSYGVRFVAIDPHWIPIKVLTFPNKVLGIFMEI